MMRSLFCRDIKAALAAGSGISVSWLFFCSAIMLLPFAGSASAAFFAQAGPGLLWLFALLSVLLGLDRLFQTDKEDGSLDILLASADFTALTLAVFSKIAAHWTVAVLPLVLAAPVLSLLLNLDWAHAGAACLSLMLGTPAIAAVGAVGAALTVSLPRGGVLLSVLVLPLTVPIIIFGIAAAAQLAEGGSPEPLYLLLALSLFFTFAAPPAAAAALRNLTE